MAAARLALDDCLPVPAMGDVCLSGAGLGFARLLCHTRAPFPMCWTTSRVRLGPFLPDMSRDIADSRGRRRRRCLPRRRRLFRCIPALSAPFLSEPGSFHAESHFSRRKTGS